MSRVKINNIILANYEIKNWRIVKKFTGLWGCGQV